MKAEEIRGKTFYSKYLVNQGNHDNLPKGASLPIEVDEINTDENNLVVYWGSGIQEDWNLEHTLGAFERGEYSFKPFHLTKYPTPVRVHIGYTAPAGAD